ncbi:MAG TPA: sensor histidine kinase [Propionibacteriaceae bacterium]|nr:sensor histidine kinase [Propionibacteriaceae bacterium]
MVLGQSLTAANPALIGLSSPAAHRRRHELPARTRPGRRVSTTAFERFRRGPGSTGTGLGLAIVAAVAEAHGGRATIGPGSQVTITLASGEQ